ncbi:MAG TPA: Crp/Fnr family transcriptional regulator, partial [Cytophagales bacterium]|nr:Crp/Fnr family transcriptional regulator [Cytophagales bacterium]
MAEQLLSFVKSLVTLPPQEETKLRNHAKESHIKKGRFYISEGQIPNKFAFVNQGLFRYMYRDHKGNEYTKNFITEGQFITSYSAMASQSPSKMYIEALEDSSLTELHYSDWLQLKNGDPCWNAFLVVVLEKAFAIKEQRERDLLLLDAQQ